MDDNRKHNQPAKTASGLSRSQNAAQAQSATALRGQKLDNSGSQPRSTIDDITQLNELHHKNELPGEELKSGNLKKALTQISNDFLSAHTSQGFIDAQNDANLALADHKIILNHRFVLESILGAGGMGTVYKAQDLRKVEAQDSQSHVAVKVLNSDFKNHPDAFVSLQREASRSHLLSHPNIVTVHDFDRDGDTIYMTMELLQGQDLESLLADHKGQGLPQAQAQEIIRDYCSALAFAHEKGIIHSDLKPGNIFVTPQGAKVLDFGIARLASESQYKDHFDAGNIGAITPAYASLEMLDNKEPQASDDVYAAAIIAYEMYSGRHPFNNRSAASALALGLKPDRLDELSKRQWQALSAALEIKRSDRSDSVLDFMKALTEKPRLPTFKLISIFLFVVLLIISYVKFLMPDELTRVIDETYSVAQQCYSQGDLDCAIHRTHDILKIAPEHVHAQALLAKAESLQQTQQINGLLAEGEACFEQQNYQCVLDKSTAAIQIEPNQEQAQALIQKAQTALTQQLEQEKQAQQEFVRYLDRSQQCFAQKQYACAIERANKALTIEPDNAQAKALLQNADYAQRQQQENLNKADKVLRDGQGCFEKLDFSCAIAKSESALEFVPGHKEALRLKRAATQSLKKVKQTIEIQ